MSRGARVLPLALAGLLAAGGGRAQTGGAGPLEPPPEAPEGVDYVIEPADSLAEGDVELGVGAAGRAGGTPVGRRRVRFSGDDLSGTVRDGSHDPIAGGSIDGRGRLGQFTAGRLAPRWGRGLLLGAAGDPWQRDALDRGASAAFRGRAGEGVLLRHGAGDGFDLVYGRFSRRRLGGARVRRRELAAGVLVAGGRAVQASLAMTRGPGEGELVWERSGRWRAEALLERALFAAPDSGSRRAGWRATGRARGGSNGFASLAEGSRPGPARALAAGLSGPLGRWRLETLGSLWRFRPGIAGARAGLAVERPLAHHGALSLGFEEQRGARRDRGDAATASPGARGEGLRQGWWGEWWSGAGALALGARHESWGERPWGRAVVRSVTSARLEARGPADVRLAIAHSVFRARRGESLYLPEAESDRLVLRAVSGEGARTRIEVRAPFAGGRARAALYLSAAPDRRARPDWTLDWTRKAHLRRSAGPPE